jgi:hypothetical protein
VIRTSEMGKVKNSKKYRKKLQERSQPLPLHETASSSISPGFLPLLLPLLSQFHRDHDHCGRSRLIRLPETGKSLCDLRKYLSKLLLKFPIFQPSLHLRSLGEALHEISGLQSHSSAPCCWGCEKHDLF